MIEIGPTPAPGTIVRLDDQAYELRGRVPHVRADGTPSELFAWDAACAACGAGFVALSPTASVLRGLSRRCSECSKPGKPVKGKRRRKVKVEVEYP